MAVRVGLVGDDFIINPTYAEIEAETWIWW